MVIIAKKDLLNFLKIGKKAFNKKYRNKIIEYLQLSKPEYDNIKFFDYEQSEKIIQLFPKLK
jgi:hypothetical protein